MTSTRVVRRITPHTHRVGCGFLLLIFVLKTWPAAQAAPATQPAPPTAVQPVVPSPNAYDYYVQAGQALVPGTAAVDPIYGRVATGGGVAQDERLYPLATKQAWLRQNARALALLRQGFDYPYLEPPNRPINDGLGPITSFRALARALMVESHARSQQGDWSGAAASALDAMRLGQDVARGGMLISALVSYAIQALSHRELWRILPHLDAVAARVATARLEGLLEHRVPFAATMEQEKRFGLAQLINQMQGTDWRHDVGDGLSASERKLLATSTSATIIANYSRLMDAIIDNSRRPYRQQQPVPPPGDPVTAIIAPMFANARCSAARNEADNDMLMVALALRAYQLEHHAYPGQLADLVPVYLKQVPPDAFGSGEPLRYRVQGDTYVLWSIGPDGVDNGGQPINDLKAATTANPDAARLVKPESHGDIVAGVNR